MNSSNNNTMRPPTVRDILDAMDAVGAKPRLAGSLMGIPVYVSGSVPDDVVELRGPTETIRFRVDHPRLAGSIFVSRIRQ